MQPCFFPLPVGHPVLYGAARAAAPLPPPRGGNVPRPYFTSESDVPSPIKRRPRPEGGGGQQGAELFARAAQDTCRWKANYASADSKEHDKREYGPARPRCNVRGFKLKRRVPPNEISKRKRGDPMGVNASPGAIFCSLRTI